MNKEEKKDQTVISYDFEELDNGVVMRDDDWAEVALFHREEGHAKTSDRDVADVIKLIGKFIYGDLRAYQDLHLANKVKIIVKFEKGK